MTRLIEPATSAPVRVPIRRIDPNPFSIDVYGDPDGELERDGLLASVADQGILVPLVLERRPGRRVRIISGHRRWACARRLGLPDVLAVLRRYPSEEAARRAVLDHNQQRRKTFSQMMREADALEALVAARAEVRRRGNLRQFAATAADAEGESADRRDSDARGGRTDATIGRLVGLGAKDLYRQARAVWRAADAGDDRARAAVAQIDAGTKSIHAAAKDLRRRDRFTAGFRPNPYDVWAFRHDPAFGVPHPGAIPAALVAHLLHYFTAPGDLVVDPMAGGGTTLDVCAAMGRRCLAYDLEPCRESILRHDVRIGFTPDALGCDLIFCDPPYHTMQARRSGCAGGGVAEEPLDGWLAFLDRFARDAFATLRPGGHAALLVANQTEKDVPPGLGYLDHAFLGYQACVAAGFLPARRISCPMSGHYLPQHVREARRAGRLLGQVRDLVVVRKPEVGEIPAAARWLRRLAAAGADHPETSPSGSPAASS